MQTALVSNPALPPRGAAAPHCHSHAPVVLARSPVADGDDAFVAMLGAYRGSGGLARADEVVALLERGGLAGIATRTPEVAALSAIPTEPTPTRRILVVDDEEAVARNFARMLAPHSVDVAHNGRDALARCATSRYDVVICDLMMPDVTGMEVYTQLVAGDATAAGRFLFMTGGAFTDKARDFLDKTPVRCLEKPISKSDLHRAVADVVAGT